jgi:glycosyltransferase involved in cell wall biosynthesis
MSEPVKISVITVCKNEVKTIERTIRSVAEQTYQQIEHVIVDGQSTDGTVDVLENYEHRCRIISERDDGLYDAMNKGVKNATGDFLLFLNAGDYLLHESVIDSCVTLMSQVSDPVDVFYGDVLLYNAEQGSGSLWAPQQRSRLGLFKTCLPHPSTFFSKQAFEKNGLFDTSFKIAGDYEWFIRGMEKNNIRYSHINALVTLFNTGGVSTHADFRQLHQQEKNRIYRMHYSKRDRVLFKIGVFFKKNFKFL